MVGFLIPYIRSLTKKKKKKKERHLRVDKSGPGLRRRQGSSHHGAFVKMHHDRVSTTAGLVP